MNKHLRLLSNNKAWAAQQVDQNQEFFKRLTEQQSPQFLWIGCADSRVPANEIVGLLPGELFVHRNVARTTILCDAWARGQEIWVRGWVYSLNDGLHALLQPIALSMEPAR
jgi:carbonic anhydrase